MPGPTVAPGQPADLFLEFFDETSGVLTNPASVQLDITYGTSIDLGGGDVAGPFVYDGASTPATGQIWRIGVGQFGFAWPVPSGIASGVYVANWTCGYDGKTFLGVENFDVTGGSLPARISGDFGYWTGGISYGDLDIEFGVTDSDGITWLWQKLEGWDGPDVTGGLLQKAGDQGAWPSPQFFQPRTLTWTVTASAPTQALRDLARSKLSQAIPVSDLALLRYDEPIPKQAQVRRSGKITEAYPTLTDVTFTVGLVAPDPRKYATQLKTVELTSPQPAGGITFPLTFPVTFPAGAAPGALVSLTNAGDFETRPGIAIQGPVTGPALVNTATGQAVSWSGLTLSDSDVLAVDFLNQQSFLNGSYRSADPSSLWWNLPPGTTVIKLQSISNPGAVVTAAWRDAWI
ncbi:MAG: hypothetical protein JWO67_6154 [Streptosporangiaceae bacterium]|nr:hypothetical protein [Streptosporangiaceae bacterium]